MKKLELTFKDAKGYRTRDGAERKLAKHEGLFEEHKVLAFAWQRPCGSWLPIAILSDANEWLCGMLASRGICVTKA